MTQTPMPLSADQLLEHLEHLALASGVPFNHARARHALDNQGDFQSITEALSGAAESFGLDARQDVLPLREILARLGPVSPALVVTSGVPEGLVIIEARPRRIRIADSEHPSGSMWITRRELQQRLGLDSSRDDVDCLLVQPQLALQDMHEGGHHHPSPLRRMIALLGTERRDVIVVLIYAVGIGILTLATPLAVESLVNTITFGGLIQPLLIVSILLFGSLAFAAVLRIMQTILVEFVQRRIFVRLIADLAYRLPRVMLAAFDHQHGPELVNRFFDVVTVQKVTSTLLLEGISLVLATFIGALLLAVYHPYLLIYDIVLLTAMIGVTYLLGRGAIRTSIAESLAKYDVAEHLEELARAPAAFKLGAGPAMAVEAADRTARNYLSARAAHFRIVLRQIIFALTLQALASTVLLGLGGWLVISGQLTLGQLVAAELIVTVVIGSFTKIGKHLESYYDLMAAMDKLGHLIDLPLEQDGLEKPKLTEGGVAISMRHATFHHEHTGRSVFEDYSVQINRGESVAVVGPSGSGKSTFLDLLHGLRLPNSGGVYIEGTDTKVINLAALRQVVAMTREMDIVAGTVVDNVRMGRYRITAAEISDALAQVELLDDLTAFPQGLATELCPSGAPLSRGQAFRLVLARAIVGRPGLLLVDGLLDIFEPALRQRLVKVLLDPAAQRTVVIVTQCPDIIECCDHVVSSNHFQSSGPHHQSTGMNGESYDA